MSNNPPANELLLYGTHPVEAVLRHKPESVTTVYLSERMAAQAERYWTSLAAEQSVAVRQMDSDWFARELAGLPHQKIAALYRQAPPRDLQWLMGWLKNRSDATCLLALDGIQDPQNFGACLRVAEALGAHAVVYPRVRQATLNATTYKVSAGAAALVTLVEVANLARALRQLKSAEFWIYGADSEATVSLDDVDFARQSLVVMGAEGEGLRANTRDQCDLLFAIPMSGQTSSLNVSVATGIALHRVQQAHAGK